MQLFLTIAFNVLTIIIVILILIFLACFLVVQLFFVRPRNQELNEYGEDWNRKIEPEYQKYHDEAYEGTQWFRKQNYEEVSIQSFDNLKLCAYFLPAKEETTDTILLVHGYRAFGLYEFGSRVKFLHEQGWNLLIVDNRAHGRSEGKYIGFSILDRRDVCDWIDYLDKRFDSKERIVLHGVSMGGATVLAVAGTTNSKNVKGVVADCGYSSGFDEVAIQISNLTHLPKFPFLYLCVWWLKVLAGYRIDEVTARDAVKNYNGKLLIIHGGEDTFVPTAMGHEIYEAASCDKDIMIVDGALHALSYTDAPEAYQAKFSEFLGRIE